MARKLLLCTVSHLPLRFIPHAFGPFDGFYGDFQDTPND